MRADVDENALPGQHARGPVTEMHFQGLRRHKAPVAHDQLGTGRLVIVQVRLDLALDHVTLALEDGRHVGCDGTGHHAELRAVTRQMADLRAPDLVLARQAGDVGTRPADPAPLDDGGPPSRLRHMPRQQLPALSAAQDEDVKLFWLRHGAPR